MLVSGVQIEGPRRIAIVEQTLPEPEAGQVEVRSICSAISHGTEMNVYRGDAPMWHMAQDRATRLFLPDAAPQWHYPMAYGYACVGEITRVGAEVSTVAPEDRVFCYAPHRSGHLLPHTAVIKLPPGMNPELGVFLANLNTAFNGILDADLHLGETVVVFGLGVIGQLMVRLAKLSGAARVVAVDLIDARLALAQQHGSADVTLNPRDVGDIALAVRALTDQRGADVAFEVSASDRALHEAIRTVCYNGKVIVMSWYAGGLPNVYLGREFHHNRIQLLCSQTGNIRPELGHRWTLARRQQAVLKLLPELELHALISHRIDHRQAADAYALIDHHPDQIMQVILTYPSH